MKEKLLKVKALRTGYYGEERRYAGEEFAMKESDFFYADEKGERVEIEDEDGDTVYKTASWVDLIKEDYDPQEDVAKPAAKNKVKIGPRPKGKDGKEVEAFKPQSGNPNPEGFAAGPTPAKSHDKGVHHADAAPAKPAKVHVGKGHSSDDVI